MNTAMVKQIADAVLYEGYLLYPYRPSVKNRHRWTFGGLYPRAYTEAQGQSEPTLMKTECLVAGNGNATLEVQVRFLHLRWRRVGEGSECSCRLVEALRVGEKVYHPWQEAIEREVIAQPVTLAELVDRPRQQGFTFPASREREPICNAGGAVVGVFLREQEEIVGILEVSARPVGADRFCVTASISNRTPLEAAEHRTRDDALLHSFISTHTILGTNGGEFVSLIDPPEDWREAAEDCKNIGTWPVLVGEEGKPDMMLSSPIILYDYPRVAPESPGNLFDGTEIDEILSLRILTLTDEEKRAAEAVDDRARDAGANRSTRSRTTHGVARLHAPRGEERS